jgi:hypothetical protein
MALFALPVFGRDTEEQLQERFRNEQNPIKKAKLEIKLADMTLQQALDTYTKGDVESGAKLLGEFVEQMEASWKILQNSGRKASKQPQGFKELDISLREDFRLLEDLERRVAYFDRGPVEKAAQEIEGIRSEVLQALFPAAKPLATSPVGPTRFGLPCGIGSEVR